MGKAELGTSESPLQVVVHALRVRELGDDKGQRESKEQYREGQVEKTLPVGASEEEELVREREASSPPPTASPEDSDAPSVKCTATGPPSHTWT